MKILLFEKPVLFNAGKVVFTPAARAALPGEFPHYLFSRHLTGDWGDVNDNDRARNDLALLNNERLVSEYQVANFPEEIRSKYYELVPAEHQKPVFYVITEWDRSVTTILLPEEY